MQTILQYLMVQDKNRLKAIKVTQRPTEMLLEAAQRIRMRHLGNLRTSSTLLRLKLWLRFWLE